MTFFDFLCHICSTYSYGDLKSDNYILSISIIFCLLLSSCVDKIALPDTTDPAMIHIECELSPPFHIKAHVSTTGDLNGKYLPYYPEDAELRLFSQIDEEFIFKYNPDKKYYEVLNGRLRAGFSYTVSAKLKDTTISTAYASNVIPKVVDVDSIDIHSIEEFFNADGSKDIYTTIKVYLPEILTEGTFYRMDFYYRIRHEVIENGQRKFTYDPSLKSTVMETINTGGAAVHPLYHMPGMLIDPSRLDENYFAVTLKSKEPIDEKDLRLSSVHSKLYTLSESYYRYQLASSKQLKIEDKNLIEPVIDYTNIQNGLGYFGSYVIKSDSIVVR